MRAVGVGRWLYKAPKPGPSLIDIARHSMRQGLCNGTMSLRPFVCLSRLSSAAAACGRLLPWARWALGTWAGDVDWRRRPPRAQQQMRAVSYCQLNTLVFLLCYQYMGLFVCVGFWCVKFSFHQQHDKRFAGWSDLFCVERNTKHLPIFNQCFSASSMI